MAPAILRGKEMKDLQMNKNIVVLNVSNEMQTAFNIFSPYN